MSTPDASDSASYTETKLLIPFPSASHRLFDIVGILAERRSASSEADTPRPLALIMHGVLAHKDQSYHKLLARSLPIDSFRFDFRTNGETEGSAAEGRGRQGGGADTIPDTHVPEWDMAKFERDEDDIDCVLAFLSTVHGYTLDLLVGHSRGSLVGWGWMAKQYGPARSRSAHPHLAWLPPTPPLWVSLSGRWVMSRIHDRDSLYAEEFARQGFYTWNVKVAGKAVSVRITPQQVEEFARYDIAGRVGEFPAEADCLLIHGTSDETVPVPDVGFYLNALTSRADRGPGQTQVHLVEDAGHMFKGKYDEVVRIILQWYEARLKLRPRRVEGVSTSVSAEETAEVGMLERAWREGIHAAHTHAGISAVKSDTDKERL